MNETYANPDFHARVHVAVSITDAEDVPRLALEPWRTWHGAQNLPVHVTGVTAALAPEHVTSNRGAFRVAGFNRRKGGELGAEVAVTVTAAQEGLPAWLVEVFDALREQARAEFAKRLREDGAK